MKPFHQLIDIDLIFFIRSQTRDDVIRQLILNVDRVKKIPSREEFYTAVVTREKVVTTGIGMGVAIPHAKLSTLPNFFIAIGILEKGIDWRSLDGHPVRLVFLIGGPDDKQNQYLKILSSLTLAIKDDETRKQLFNSTTPEEAYASFT